jgi:two-component system, NtrC family, response regulator PilR
LENLLHRALALSGNDLIGPHDLGLSSDDGFESTQEMPLPAPEAAPAPDMALPTDLQAHLDGIERDILLRALERHRFNRTAAGASLGLSLRQMRYRMARLGVDAGGD